LLNVKIWSKLRKRVAYKKRATVIPLRHVLRGGEVFLLSLLKRPGFKDFSLLENVIMSQQFQKLYLWSGISVVMFVDFWKKKTVDWRYTKWRFLDISFPRQGGLYEYFKKMLSFLWIYLDQNWERLFHPLYLSKSHHFFFFAVTLQITVIWW